MPTTRIHTVPTEGLSHPIFQKMSAADHLITLLVFAEAPDDDASNRIEALYTDWAGKLPGGADAIFSEEPILTGRGLRLRTTNLEAPLKQIPELIKAISKEAPLKETFFARWSPDEGSELMFPATDPRAPEESFEDYEDAEAFAEAVFDEDGPPPPSENFANLRGAFELDGGDLVLEDRGSPVFRPGLKIAYGLVPMIDLDRDARTEKVEAALLAAIDEGFANIFYPGGKEWRPGVSNRQQENGRISTFEWEGRRAYSFGIPASDLLFMASHSYCRYREPEMFDVLERVIAKMKLEPRITWQRLAEPISMTPLSQPTMYVFQLWEPAK